MKLEGLSRKHNGAFKFMKKMDHRDTYFRFEHIAYAHSVTET